jgi:protein-disulfide isomerase
MQKITIRLVLASLSVLALANCSPSPAQLQKTLEANPEIVLNMIEKHPEKFMEVVQKAARAAESKSAESQQAEEKARIDREMQNPLKPELADDRAAKGPKDAPITIVAYSDFQCPYCSRGFTTMEQVLKAYDGKVRFIYKHLPLEFHPLAMPAAKRFEAIALQSPEKAYAFHDEVFKNQQKLGSEGEKFLDAAAKKIGANVAKMKTDMESDKVQEHIKADMAEAQKFEISGTPGYVVSGVSVRGAYPFETFKQIIDKKLASSK